MYRTIGLPHRPTMDHVVPYVVLKEMFGRELGVRFFNQGTEFTAEQMASLDAEGVYLAGVRRGHTYKDYKGPNGETFGSQTALLLHILHRSNSELPNAKVFSDLADLMDRNNSKGILIKQAYSVPWIVRQAYRLGHDPDEAEFEFFNDEEVVHHAAQVVRAWLLARTGKQLRTREAAEVSRVFEMLPKGVRNQFGPFSVAGYMRDMLMAGHYESDVRERGDWLVRVHNRAKERMRMAEAFADAHKDDLQTFPLGSHTEQGTWVDSHEPWLMEVLNNRRHLVVMRNDITGNVIAMSKTFSLALAGEALAKMEPGLWHYEPESRNILCNGTENVIAVPTGLADVVLQQTIGSLAVPRKNQAA